MVWKWQRKCCTRMLCMGCEDEYSPLETAKRGRQIRRRAGSVQGWGESEHSEMRLTVCSGRVWAGEVAGRSVFREPREKDCRGTGCGRNEEEAGEREEQYRDENGRNDW